MDRQHNGQNKNHNGQTTQWTDNTMAKIKITKAQNDIQNTAHKTKD
jgi:hypothetical protein